MKWCIALRPLTPLPLEKKKEGKQERAKTQTAFANLESPSQMTARPRTDKTRQQERERKRRQRERERKPVGNLVLPNINYAETGELFRANEILPDRSDNDPATLVWGIQRMLAALRGELDEA